MPSVICYAWRIHDAGIANRCCFRRAQRQSGLGRSSPPPGASQAALKRRLTPSAEEKQKILRARARSLAIGSAKRVTPQSLSLEVVEFVLGPEHYGIESSHIREIHPLSEFTPLPCTPAFVLGLVNVRGQILSIINIKKLFDLPEKGLTDLNGFVCESIAIADAKDITSFAGWRNYRNVELKESQ
jgi:hypothetical protein